MCRGSLDSSSLKERKIFVSTSSVSETENVLRPHPYLMILERFSPSKFLSSPSISKLMKHSVNRPPTPDADAADVHGNDELSLREIINIKLVESGEKENLMDLVRDRLLECGWKDDMKAICREHIKKRGRNDVTVDELIRVITPKGRASVPDGVKAELLQRIRSFIVSAAR